MRGDVLLGCVARDFARLMLSALVIGSAGALTVAIVWRIGEGVITAYATVFLALVTTALAAYTAVLAKDTRSGLKLLDRHHQEGVTPIVKHITSLFPPHYEASREQEDIIGAHEVVFANRGNGPALRVEVCFEIEGIEREQCFELGPLGAGEEESVDITALRVPRGFKPNFSKWKMEVRYNNLFGAPGKTVYVSATNQPFYFRPPVIDRPIDT